MIRTHDRLPVGLGLFRLGYVQPAGLGSHTDTHALTGSHCWKTFPDIRLQSDGGHGEVASELIPIIVHYLPTEVSIIACNACLLELA